tara:strand:- start:171 stop:683 length:513 start_codon:yes stop_codon:yes gene_type:complete
VKKIFFFILFLSFVISKSFACEILNVPIGTPVNLASEKLDFLTLYKEGEFDEGSAIEYYDYAEQFCSQGEFKNTELQVVVYDSKVAAIRLISEIKDQPKEVYTFTKNFVKDPGPRPLYKNWKGVIDLSIGDLKINYAKHKINGLLHEILEITSEEMSEWISGEHVISQRM